MDYAKTTICGTDHTVEGGRIRPTSPVSVRFSWSLRCMPTVMPERAALSALSWHRWLEC